MYRTHRDVGKGGDSSKVRLHAESVDLQNLEENCLRFEGFGVVLDGAIMRLDRMDLDVSAKRQDSQSKPF
jgi:hypothetical protein